MATTAEGNISHMAVKLATFWPARPQHWFIQAESQFELGKIQSDSTKFHYIIAALPENVIVKIKPSVLESGSYSQLKDEIMKLYRPADTEVVQKFLSMKTYGLDVMDVYAECSSLLNSIKGDLCTLLIREKIAQCLDADKAPLLRIVSADLSVEEYLKRASALQKDQTNDDDDQVHNIYDRYNHKKYHYDKKYNLCFYHARFGKNAYKCQTPDICKMRICPAPAKN